MYDERRSHVAKAILAYLLEHPDAQDTLAGIAEWWLPEEEANTQLAIVKNALDQLIAQGRTLLKRRRPLPARHLRPWPQPQLMRLAERRR